MRFSNVLLLTIAICCFVIATATATAYSTPTYTPDWATAQERHIEQNAIGDLVEPACLVNFKLDCVAAFAIDIAEARHARLGHPSPSVSYLLQALAVRGFDGGMVSISQRLGAADQEFWWTPQLYALRAWRSDVTGAHKAVQQIADTGERLWALLQLSRILAEVGHPRESHDALNEARAILGGLSDRDRLTGAERVKQTETDLVLDRARRALAESVARSADTADARSALEILKEADPRERAEWLADNAVSMKDPLSEAPSFQMLTPAQTRELLAAIDLRLLDAQSLLSVIQAHLQIGQKADAVKALVLFRDPAACDSDYCPRWYAEAYARTGQYDKALSFAVASPADRRYETVGLVIAWRMATGDCNGALTDIAKTSRAGMREVADEAVDALVQIRRSEAREADIGCIDRLVARGLVSRAKAEKALHREKPDPFFGLLMDTFGGDIEAGIAALGGLDTSEQAIILGNVLPEMARVNDPRIWEYLTVLRQLTETQEIDEAVYANVMRRFGERGDLASAIRTAREFSYPVLALSVLVELAL